MYMLELGWIDLVLSAPVLLLGGPCCSPMTNYFFPHAAGVLEQAEEMDRDTGLERREREIGSRKGIEEKGPSSAGRAMEAQHPTTLEIGRLITYALTAVAVGHPELSRYGVRYSPKRRGVPGRPRVW